MSTKPIVVHHLENARSQRILWLLVGILRSNDGVFVLNTAQEELEVPYMVKKYKRTPQRRAPQELLNVHPLGKSPVITDGDVTLAESGAIVEYIIHKYGKDKVQVPEAGWLDNLYFTHYAEGSVQPILVRRLLFRIIPENVPGLIRPILRAVFSKVDQKLTLPELKLHGTFIESHLAKTKGWFAGGSNPTSADYMMAFTLEIMIDRAPECVGDNIMDYVKRVQAR